MNRNEFREAVFERDHHECVVCGAPAQDAHHITERRLWPDGGYILDNGVSLCGQHHLGAESTRITCRMLRSLAGIEKVVLPPHLHPDEEYDKWGNLILPDGRRLPGELYYDESVQKILDPEVEFVTWVKYPRTPHLPWSNPTDDDLMLDYVTFAHKPVVITEKMDGENTTMYSDYIHSRSLDMSYHQSRTWVKNLHSKIAHEIPEGWRIVGENLYAKHAIAYRDLPSFFMVFSIWDKDTCLSWKDTTEYCAMLGLETVPVIWKGDWDSMALFKEFFPKPTFSTEIEGYVVRNVNSFKLKDFRDNIAKYVRPNHVNADTQNWKAKRVEPNLLDKPRLA
jgi:hypothetical protein